MTGKTHNPYHEPEVQQAINTALSARKTGLSDQTRAILRGYHVASISARFDKLKRARAMEILLARIKMNEDMRRDVMAALIRERARG